MGRVDIDNDGTSEGGARWGRADRGEAAGGGVLGAG
jgi:hypothetical protein